ncbi:FG-GAP-like repeat-containing protein [Phytohabitans houttuyneae]|uniref:Cutinase family protein n=1 Tax=Phytohabitans houttuyneae TaxID=1076126 RepID=A0A6V8KGK4_9ACTN|nr:cutinase family protein [Phytohabitans houttuyneae]GFJ82954.1 hypothetical protein Phou_071340 [Phytohabitans houttuyneae]
MRRFSRLATILAITLASSLGSPAQADPGGCRDYEIIGVRGSGESYVGPHGMSWTVGAAADHAAGQLMSYGVSADDIGFYSLVYPATKVNAWNIISGEYWTSMEEGVTTLKQALEGVALGCPGQRVILIGYSQGAHVIHTALDRNLTAAQKSVIRAILLIADPAGRLDARYSHVLYQPTGEDLGPGTGGGILDHALINSEFHGRTQAICIYADLVCDDAGNAYSHGLYGPLVPYWSRLVAGIAFAPPTSTTPIPSAYDFSGDGKPDLVFRRSTDSNLHLLDGNGARGWMTGQPRQIGNGWGDAELLTWVSDFSGDGKPDVVWRKAGDKNLYMMEGNGAGGWKTGQARQIGTGWGDAELLTSVPDFSGDLEPDLIWRKAGDKNLYMIEGNGTGGWKTGQVKRIGTGWGDAELLVSVPDFSGDGEPDLIWRKAGDKNLYMLEGNGAGGWKTGQARQIGTGWGDAELLTSRGDFSGDGEPDLIWRKAGDKNLYVIEGNGTGGWKTGPVQIGTGWGNVDAIP